MLPSTAFPLKDFGRFIKKNKVDFPKLPHDSFKPWPSSALRNARVRAGCLPLCTRHFNGANTFLSEQVCTCSTSPSPVKGGKSTTFTAAKSPHVCDHSERFSRRLCIQWTKYASFKHTQQSILTAVQDLLCMNTLTKAEHHPGQVNI